MTPTALGADLSAAVEALLVDRWTPERRRQDWLAGFDPALFLDLGHQGVFASLLTEEAGGLGLGLAEVAPLARVFGRHLLGGPWPESLVVAPFLAGHLRAATVALEPVLAGGGVLAFADGAAWSSSTPAGLGGFAMAGGRLSGEMRLVRFAGEASQLLMVAESPTPALILAESAHPAIQVVSEGSVDPASRFGRVVVEDFPLQAGLVVGGDEAAAAIEKLRNKLRIVTAWEMAGVVARLVAMSTEYALQRVQFGRPIGGFQAVAHLLSEMTELSNSLDNLCDAVTVDLALPPEPLSIGSWILKAHAARVGPQVALLALQVHGGIGFTEEHDLHLYLKRALALQDHYGGERDLYRAIGLATFRVGKKTPKSVAGHRTPTLY